MVTARKTFLQKAFPYLLLLPAGSLVAIFKLYPIAETLLGGFFQKGQLTLEVYKNIFQDANFWSSLWITFKFNLITIPLQLIISFCLGLLVNVNVRGIGIFRVLFFSTFAISTTIAVLIWEKFFNFNSGLFNSILATMGIKSQGFLLSKEQALLCIIIIATWKGCGYWMIFFLSGLKSIDASIYESAKMDGAGAFTTVFKITIPLIRRIILFVCVANTTANMLLFAPVHMSTQGGPQGSTNLLMYEAYKSAFKYTNHSRAGAIVTVLVFIIALICFVQFKILNTSEATE